MARPKGIRASDGKCYTIRHTLSDLNDGRGEEGILPFWMVRVNESAEQDADFLVREWTNDPLACPVCNEYKKCFASAPAWGHSEIKQGMRAGREMYFRLIVKACPVSTAGRHGEFYLFEQVCNPYEHLSLGKIGYVFERRVYQNVIRFIPEAHFRAKCVSCPSSNVRLDLVKDEGMWLSQANCRSCFLRFYVTHCPIVSAGDFKEVCPNCKSAVSSVASRTVSALYITCGSCRWRGAIPLSEELIPKTRQLYVQNLLSEMEDFDRECEQLGK